MESKELRIGNKVYYSVDIRRIGEVTGIHKTEEGLRVTIDYHYPLSFARPIPLSPELLVKCGFILLHNLGQKEYSLCIDEHTIIEACELEGVWYLRLVLSEDNNDMNIDLSTFTVYKYFFGYNFFHQLQNLYYSLTGTELPVNL